MCKWTLALGWWNMAQNADCKMFIIKMKYYFKITHFVYKIQTQYFFFLIFKYKKKVLSVSIENTLKLSARDTRATSACARILTGCIIYSDIDRIKKPPSVIAWLSALFHIRLRSTKIHFIYLFILCETIRSKRHSISRCQRIMEN